jgi:CheY-like chemotaxis protein
MDGYECTRRLRALPDQHKFAVVAITAQALKGDRERMIDAGFDDYLPKPFRKKALISKISENLEVSTSIAGESEN